MMDKKISVLVVDDSALMRSLMGRIVRTNEKFELLGTAMNGEEALQKLKGPQPDVITLDMDMPKMNGLEFLRKYKSLGYTMPVIIVSSDADFAIEALSLGAVDFVNKYGDKTYLDTDQISIDVTNLIEAYGKKYQLKQRLTATIASKTLKNSLLAEQNQLVNPNLAEKTGSSITPPFVTTKHEILPKYTQAVRTQNAEVICIGVSTGGPAALRDVCLGLDKDLPLPILIVQHMPVGFTLEFAKSLDRICPLTVKEAANNDIIRKGNIYIAPGNAHIVVEKRGSAPAHIKLVSSPPVNSHRPSVDVLFESIRAIYANRALAVIMTGMGRDGAKEIGELYRIGAITLAQDKESSVVYGMPKVAIEAGYINEVVALKDMAARINKWAKTLTLTI